MHVGDDISTDEIMPAGSRILPFRSNIPEISKFVFSQVDESYYDRAMEHRDQGHFVVGGQNYGQGSSREHAAIAPRYLGVRAKIAKGYARIHRANLINFGILPLEFVDEADHEKIDQGDYLVFKGLRKSLKEGGPVSVYNKTKDESYQTRHHMTDRQVKMILEGSRINVVRQEHTNGEPS